LAVALFLGGAGCDKPDSSLAPEIVAKVGETTLTAADFNAAFTIASAALPAGDIADPEGRKKARRDFLEQTIEEMIVLERGRELGIKLSPAEIQKALADIRQDYPEDSFEKMFEEQAIAYDVWLGALKRRILIQKIVDRDMPAVRVSDEEVRQYALENPEMESVEEGAPDDPELEALEKEVETLPPGEMAEGEEEPAGTPLASGEAAALSDAQDYSEAASLTEAEMERLREIYAPLALREKTDLAYQKWFAGLKTRYTIFINWEAIK
jgi:hypothetical protein